MNRLLIFLAALSLFAGAQAQRAVRPASPRHAEQGVVLRTPTQAEKKSTFILISKKELRLYVYKQTASEGYELLASFPVCLSKNKGQKQRRGDMKTPESGRNKPFTISMIQDASTWCHDFHDGRGNIRAYGNWFLRLVTPGHSGIGIHGSTNNENSVPGRASEGCIRLLDQDIIKLKENFAFKGMRVYILAEDEGPQQWEIDARNAALGDN